MLYPLQSPSLEMLASFDSRYFRGIHLIVSLWSDNFPSEVSTGILDDWKLSMFGWECYNMIWY